MPLFIFGRRKAMKKKLTFISMCAAALALAGCSSSSGKNESTADKSTEATTKETGTDSQGTTKDQTAEQSTEGETTGETADVMSYAEYMAAEEEAPVKVDVFVQATQSWWDNKISVYAADVDGGYFIYDMACSQEDAAKLEPGTEIIVNGYKGEWSGEIEVKDATFEFGSDETGFYSTGDVAGMLGTDDIKEYMNQKVEFVQLEIVPVGKNDAGEDAAWFYKWDNSGSEGDDLYFKVTDGNGEYTFTVESSLCGPDTEVYKAVKELKVGDQVSFEGFLYWYEGPNPHITSVTIAE